jgi:hypothetical protein
MRLLLGIKYISYYYIYRTTFFLVRIKNFINIIIQIIFNKFFFK